MGQSDVTRVGGLPEKVLCVIADPKYLARLINYKEEAVFDW